MKKYLLQRYSSRLTHKVLALFDFAIGQLDYNELYEQIDEYILGTGKARHSSHPMDIPEHLASLKQIAFVLYDMNSDGHICEYDLFSLIKHNTNQLFIDSIN
jgi:hypothetical protein